MKDKRKLNPKIYLRGSRHDQFKNCVGCGGYKRVDRSGRCEACAQVDRQLMVLARRLLQQHPGMSKEEVAHTLGIEEDRVVDWIHAGQIKPKSFEKKCPNCGRLLVNKFSCDSCGYGRPPKTDEIKKKAVSEAKATEAQPSRSNRLSDNYWDRFSQISKRFQQRKLFIVPTGIHQNLNP